MSHAIAIQKLDETTFEVEVSEGGDSSFHTVHIDDNYRAKLGWSPEDIGTLLRESFEFLLERESKDAILKEFDLSIIAQYFPEYEEQLSKK